MKWKVPPLSTRWQKSERWASCAIITCPATISFFLLIKLFFFLVTNPYSEGWRFHQVTQNSLHTHTHTHTQNIPILSNDRDVCFARPVPPSCIVYSELKEAKSPEVIKRTLHDVDGWRMHLEPRVLVWGQFFPCHPSSPPITRGWTPSWSWIRS